MSFPLSLFAYPFYLLNRSPGKVGSHFDPKCDLFSPAEGKMVRIHLFNVRPAVRVFASGSGHYICRCAVGSMFGRQVLFRSCG